MNIFFVEEISVMNECENKNSNEINVKLCMSCGTINEIILKLFLFFKFHSRASLYLNGVFALMCVIEHTANLYYNITINFHANI